MSLLNAISRVLEQEIQVKSVSREKYDSEIFKKISLSKINESALNQIEDIKNILSNKITDEFATYYPAATTAPKRAQFGAKILYNVKEISSYADRILSGVFQCMNFPDPPEDLVKVFRLGIFPFC